MSVRAKFYITGVQPNHSTSSRGGRVELTPVYSSDPNHENKAFWDATPSGKIEMWINNPDAFNYFARKLNSEFYVDFTAVVVEQKA